MPSNCAFGSKQNIFTENLTSEFILSYEFSLTSVSKKDIFKLTGCSQDQKQQKAGICQCHDAMELSTEHQEENCAVFRYTVQLSTTDILVSSTSHGTGPEVIKLFSMLSSFQHEILNAHKYKNIKKLSIFQAQISLDCYFSCS